MASADLHPDLSSPYDANDPKQVKRRDIEAKRREKNSREVLATLLATPAGRNWMWELMAATHIFETSFAPDAMNMAFREGERNIGLRLVSQITSTIPDAMVQMMKERGNG